LHIIVAEKRKMLKVNAKMYNPKEIIPDKKNGILTFLDCQIKNWTEKHLKNL